MVKLRIVFIGSRGIPAKYGGNETFVEEVSKRLVRSGFKIFVTCESNKFFEDKYDKITRVHISSIQGKNITIPFINDIIATIYFLSKYSKEVDIVYYVAPDGALASIIAKLFKKKVIINPDGIEWRRMKKRSNFVPFLLLPLSCLVFMFLYLAEYLSAKLPDIVVADSLKIKEYLEKKYSLKNVTYITYGARELIFSNLSTKQEAKILKDFDLFPREYYLTVARIVAENNIHIEIEGFKKAKSMKKLVIVGNFNKKDSYTKYLYKLRGNSENIVFLDPVYDKEKLGILRKNCFAYIHAYEVGGTNPSLLEQMLFKRPVLAYDVPFNREVLQEGGIYFKDADDLANKIQMLERGEFDLKFIRKIQIKRIRRIYSWKNVAKEYEKLFRRLV